MMTPRDRACWALLIGSAYATVCIGVTISWAAGVDRGTLRLVTALAGLAAMSAIIIVTDWSSLREPMSRAEMESSVAFTDPPPAKYLPPLHGGYRPRGGYASSSRPVTDLPPPPKGPGAGSPSRER